MNPISNIKVKYIVWSMRKLKWHRCAQCPHFGALAQTVFTNEALI